MCLWQTNTKSLFLHLCKYTVCLVKMYAIYCGAFVLLRTSPCPINVFDEISFYYNFVCSGKGYNKLRVWHSGERNWCDNHSRLHSSPEVVMIVSMETHPLPWRKHSQNVYCTCFDTMHLTKTPFIRWLWYVYQIKVQMISLEGNIAADIFSWWHYKMILYSFMPFMFSDYDNDNRYMQHRIIR